MAERQLFIFATDSFFPRAKSYHDNTAKTNQRAAIPGHRPGKSILRFTAYIISLILLLPFLLIIGRDDAKLNKIERVEEPCLPQQ